MTSETTSTKDRILAATAKLFHDEGIRAVSMDALAAKTGVTKRTLYYHFRSKDDLIAAHLEARDQPNLLLFQKWFAETDGDVAEKIRGIFDELWRSARHPKWKGCGFLRTSVELINFPGHPAIVAGRRHKKRVEEWLSSVLSEVVTLDEAQATAQQIILLLDGAFSVVLLHRDPSYMLSAGEAAAALTRSAVAGSARSAVKPSSCERC
jgi:AcrR family transcriptional regulator